MLHLTTKWRIFQGKLTDSADHKIRSVWLWFWIGVEIVKRFVVTHYINSPFGSHLFYLGLHSEFVNSF